ncbi:MAG: glycosyltransferase [Meiothermus sp.]|nr:glycosyltransferase [Meiothermus sp.]
MQEQAVALRQAGATVGVLYPHLRSLRTFSLAGFRDNHFQTIIREESGIPTVRNEGWGTPRLYAWQMTTTALRLFKQYCQRFGRPDIIHAHTTLYAGVAAQALCERHGLPLVITEHWTGYEEGLASPRELELTTSTLRHAKAVFSVSERLRQTLAARVGFADAEVVPNLVDTQFFSLGKRQAPRGRVRVLCIALLAPFKRLEVLLAAVAELARQGFEVELELGGDGPERPRLEKLVDSLGIRTRVRFLGLLSQSQVREAMHRADVFVLSSEVETFGVVLIEAMSTGLPVISTRSGGPEEFVTPEVGRLVPAGDSQTLASAIEEVGTHLEQFDPEEIRRRVVERFSAPVVALKLINRYQQILQRLEGAA